MDPLAPSPTVAAGSLRALEERSLASLDWPRLLSHLADRAQTVRGRERCAGAPLHVEVRAVRAAQEEAAEVMALLREEQIPLGGITDARGLVGRARRGDVLNGRELLEIAANLESLHRLRRHLVTRADRAPRLAGIAEPIPQLTDLAALLRDSFDTRGELSASAHPQLAELRAAKARLHAEITRRIEEVVRGEAWAGALQDDYTTIRGDRYVVPLKAQAKSLDLGIVHDTSGSGQTVFVEPKEVIALNNRLVLADAELRNEERRILAHLSDVVGRQAGEMEEGLGAAGALDFAVARGRLGLDLDGATPEVVAEPRLDAAAARHPLLVLRGLDVVPNRIRLGRPHRATILSGPNTGGKTVTLKTLGLLALMTRAGIPLPAAEGAVVGVFPRVLTDIGDTQSVESDLSTFSGHVRALKEIFTALDEEGGEGALVLLDEVAVGTDPRQGAALGRALLMALLERGCVLATTTHYAELKAMAAVDSRFANARVEYDAEALRPTYRLVHGHPGRSYGLEIARRLGLPGDVLDAAERLVETQEKELEALLAEQENEARRAREEAAQAARARAEAEAAARRLAERERELRERERTLKQEVARRFEDEVRAYREEVRGVIRDLQRRPGMAEAERARGHVETGARRVRERIGPGPAPPPPGGPGRLDWGATRIGDPAFVASLGRTARIASLPDPSGRVEVLVGGARLRVAGAELAPPPEEKPDAASPRGPRLPPGLASRGPARLEPAQTELHDALRMPSNTLDLRGRRVDEALDAVTAFLDQAALAGRDVVFVLHGHGTNALRDAVRDMLRTSPYVREHRPAGESQGGDAVTAVRLT